MKKHTSDEGMPAENERTHFRVEVNNGFFSFFPQIGVGKSPVLAAVSRCKCILINGNQPAVHHLIPVLSALSIICWFKSVINVLSEVCVTLLSFLGSLAATWNLNVFAPVDCKSTTTLCLVILIS